MSGQELRGVEQVAPSTHVTAEEALALHARGRPGKIEITPTKPLTTAREPDLAYLLEAGAGIAGVAAHVPLTRIDNEFDTVVDEMHILGVKHLIIPWLPPEQRNDAGYDHVIATLTKRAPEARDAGLRMGYHNHEFEFIKDENGIFPFDRIAESTDPDLVSLEIDCGWVQYAGQDPVAIIQQYSSRVPLLHAKEEQVDGVEDLPAPGSGPMPWAAIVAAGNAAGSEYFIAEDDKPRDPMATAAAAFTNLTKLVS